MQAAPIVAISALLGSFVFLAIVLFIYRLILARREERLMPSVDDLEAQRPSRVLTVLNGKVVPMEKACRSRASNGHDWRTSILAAYCPPSAPPALPSQQNKNKSDGVSWEPSGLTTDSEKRPYVRRPTSKTVAIPRQVKQQVRLPAQVRVKRGHQSEQSQPPTYSFAIRGSTAKAYESISDDAKQYQKHSVILPPRHSSLMPLKNVLPASRTETWISPIDYGYSPRLLKTPNPPSTDHAHSAHMSKVEGRVFSDGRILDLEATTLDLADSLSALSNQAHRDLPLASPVRTTRFSPRPPHDHFVHRFKARKPKLDLTALRAASVSALPPSAFSPYRLTRLESDRSERANFTAPDATLIVNYKPPNVSASFKISTTTKQKALPSLSPEACQAASRTKQTITKTRPSSPFTSAILDKLAKVTTPSTSHTAAAPEQGISRVSVSGTVTLPKRPRTTYRHLLKSPQPSTEDFCHSHSFFLDSSTDAEESLTDISITREPTPLLPDLPRMYRFGSARCVSIYSKMAPRTVKSRPPRRLPLPIQVDGQRHWRDKPLPSPKSLSSGKATSMAAQSFVVSPLSSHFSA